MIEMNDEIKKREAARIIAETIEARERLIATLKASHWSAPKNWYLKPADAQHNAINGADS